MFPVTAVMYIMAAAPNPIVANPNAVCIRCWSRIVSYIGRLIGYIIFSLTCREEQGAAQG
jgi:hypothetical protein